jgi:putative heme-binding domain-containing protein
MRRAFVSLMILLAIGHTPCLGDEPPLPKVAEGWSIELVAKAPAIAYPTAIAVASDGSIYLGQDPMDMPGPPTVPSDSVVLIRDGKITTFADKLWAVMGLEWVDGTLYVVHAPFLSAFRDLDGDGKADSRVDLITGLGPKLPGFNGINDHIASGIRLGIDGFLYIAIGDKGLPRATGRDGSTVSMSTGGVIRVKPDGSGLEVVSTGERNPLSVALTSLDEIFTYGNDDDSKKWPNSLTHQIVGGHYGYPYEFLTAPFRALPIVDGQFGGSGTQGISYNEDGLPARFRGNLFFCDWGLQTVTRSEIAPSGATFKLVKQETIVEKGELADFRPFSIAPASDGSSLYLVDWAFNGWLADGPPSGRLFRLTYTGDDRVTPSPRPTGTDVASLIQGLDHPSLSVRRDSQRKLAAKGAVAVKPLNDRLKHEPGAGRIHALWALDAIGTPEARLAIRSVLTLNDPVLQAQEARSSGISHDRAAVPGLMVLLKSADPIVRRESAIALGKLGDSTIKKGLYEALGDSDPFASWSIRHAIRKLDAWDLNLITQAISDPKRREDALKLTDESWSLATVQALANSLDTVTNPGFKARVLSALAGNYRRYPEWSGQWFGTNPLAGSMPKKTRDWSPEGMNAVFLGLVKGLKDADPLVRRPAIGGLISVGERASPILRLVLEQETDPINLAASAQALGMLGDPRAIPSLGKLLLDPKQPVEVRSVALDALSMSSSRQAMNSRLMLLYDAKAPEALIARALPLLGKSRALPANDLAGFLENPSEAVRAAALLSFPTGKPLPINIRTTFLARLDDPLATVRNAAIIAVKGQNLREAIPKLIALAGAEATRVEASMALAEMPDVRAMAVYIAALSESDPALRKSGESALKAIRETVSTELESMARQGKFIGPSALAVERILTKFQPIQNWRVIGPFPRTTPVLFTDASAIDFTKNQIGAGGRIVAWQARNTEPDTGRVVIEDLKSGVGEQGGSGYDAGSSPDLAAFASTEIQSDRDRTVLMLVGSSGSINVSMNNQVVLNPSPMAGRPFAIDSDTARFTLKKGLNRVLVRTRQGIGTWSFSVLISDPSPTSLAGQGASIATEGLRAFALTHQGDPVNGEKIFFESRGLGCARCHAVDGKGTATIGPDLTGLANKYQKPEIIKSVVEPSNRLATGYQPLLIARRDGTVITGHLKGETDDHLDLIDAEGKPNRVLKVEISERKVSDVSMMPAGLIEFLSPVEFADLIAYLCSLKTAK